MEHDVVVVGSINADLVLEVPRHPHPGETLLGTAASVLPGGKGANQAVAAARLGARVAMVGAVGTDPYADVALAGLTEAGADLAHVVREDGATGLAVVAVADDGENTIVVIPGANQAVDPEAVAAAAEVITGAAVCVLQAEIPLTAVDAAVALAHGAGVRVLLNVAPACVVTAQTLACADPLVVNEHEAAIVLGDDPVAAQDSPEVLLDRLAALVGGPGSGSVVLTLGSAGALVHEGGRQWSVPARPVVARDTTGAGDAFVGALAMSLARGESLHDAATTATRVAAASVQRLGAQASYPWKDDPLP